MKPNPALTPSLPRAATRAAPTLFLLGALFSAPGCSGAPTPGQSITCGAETRVVLDCSSEIQYQGVKAGGKVEILKIGQASARYEEEAIREVNAELERYITLQTRLCRDLNACVLSTSEYKVQAEKIRDTFKTAAALAASAGTSDAASRKESLDKLYARVVPDSARPEQLTIEVRVDAEIPASAGGGTVLLRPGAPLPTNARVAFSFLPSKVAHLYVYQVSPSEEVTVLFPRAEMPGLSNPIPAGKATRIPPGEQRFRLNEKDVGAERVFFLASVAPVDAIDKVLRTAAQKAIHVADDPALTGVGKGRADPSKACARGLELESCPGQRGLELEPPSDVSARARTELGDGLIVQVLPFEHVTEQVYRERAKAPPAGATPSP